MKLTREKLKQIIKEELKEITGLNEVESPAKRFAEKIADIVKIDSQTIKNLSSEWKSGKEAILSNPGLSTADIQSLMPSWSQIDPLAIKFHLRKASITPQEIEKELNNTLQTKKISPGVSAPKVRELTPAERMKSVRQTYSSTQFGTKKAPPDMSEEETKEYLRNSFSGLPLWTFEILRDPTDNKLYAFYEMDTSG